ncbi:U32 family peptidase [Niveibacterium sp. SC-1]|uniref:U32 family peptidase n=1 Tax=Niveibacterium sp. SC-1 TaxID=3135646 RepID=UPI00311F0EBE
MHLTLGPILGYWPRDQVLAFYRDAANWPVDTIYLGEVVCSRRHELRLDDWRDLGRELVLAGKTVVLSTQALLESESELRTLRRIVDNGEFLIEANDLGAVGYLQGRTGFVAGPHLNIYGQETLALFAELGARRWVPPIEMSAGQLAQLMAAHDGELETEVFAWGRLPLAFSARCFTARHFNLKKDECAFRCQEFADGQLLRTREGEPFLTLNGIQTQSAATHSLLGEVDALRAMGVTHLRLSPQSQHMAEVVRLFANALQGERPASDAAADLVEAGLCNGYWHGQPGMRWKTPDARS